MKNALKLFALCLILAAVTSCSLFNRTAEWTILVYMAADNSLSEQAVQDIIEMERAKLPDNINLIVQLDPNSYFPDPQARRYKIYHDRNDYIASPVVEYLGMIDSGDWRNLADFVNWGIKEYPARKYSLVIWSHGSGWSRTAGTGTRGICPDQTNFNQISVAKGQLRRAFELFTEKIDLLLIDACLMFSMEVVTEVYRHTSYVIGSENLVPYEGFPYYEIFDGWNANRSTANIAIKIIDQYAVSHQPGGSQNQQNMERQITAAVMKSANLGLLLDLLQDFVSRWKETDYEQYAASARENCFGFHLGATEVDIKEFFTHLHSIVPAHLQSEIETIRETIDKVFIGQVSSNLPENTGTASVWFPEYPDYVTGSKELYSRLQFAQKTEWVSFLEWVMHINPQLYPQR